MNTTVSFHCSACGKCCNSPPAMTVPELLHHEDLFVGALGVRRGPAGLGGLTLATMALDFPSLDTCPARQADGLCGIHTNRKPAMCGTVPLDPHQADDRQHVVLFSRTTGAGYIGAECIVPGRREGLPVLVADGEVADPGYRTQLHGHRGALGREMQEWGDAVGALLRGQMAPPAAGDVVTLPLVPVLAVLAARSDAARRRCLRYVQRQRALLDRKVDEGLARKHPRDKPVTKEFRAYAAAYERLEAALARGGVAATATAAEALRTETYLDAAEAA